MFKIDEGYCTIGRPKGRLVAKDGEPSVVQKKVSKIGGFAVWHDKLSAPISVEDILCGVCNVGGSMVLVTQVYAPLEFDRSLYVFGCNNRKCSYQSAGWKVVRNQSFSAGVSSIESIDSSSNVLNEVKPIPDSVFSSWDSMSITSDNAFTASSAPSTPVTVAVPTCFPSSKNHNDDDESDDDDMSDLLAMLAANKKTAATSGGQNKSKNQSTVKLVAAGTKPVTEVLVNSEAVITRADDSDDVFITSTSLPSYRIAEIDEDWSRYDEDENNDDAVDRGDDDVTGGAATRSNDAHINDLIKAYLETEDDAEVLSVMSGQAMKTKKVTTQQSAAEHSVDGAVAVGGVVVEDDDEEASERVFGLRGAKDRVEQYFQRRVGRYPTQVLRYAYGGEPLWISHPNPLTAVLNGGAAGVTGSVGKSTSTGGKQSKNKATIQSTVIVKTLESIIPNCELCHAPRVFECQLMPALLSYITPSENTINTSSLNTPQTKEELLDQYLGSGLDFGVMCVYSCPNSCVVSAHSGSGRRYATECAVVQVPPDVVLGK